MWTTPKGIEIKDKITSLLEGVHKHIMLSRVKGTKADRVQAGLFGLEVLLSLNEFYEIDSDFRVKVRDCAEKVKMMHEDDDYTLVVSVGLMIERMLLIVQAL